MFFVGPGEVFEDSSMPCFYPGVAEELAVKTAVKL